MKTKTSLILTVAALALSGSALAEVKIALVAKSLGNGFFEAANVGAQQAAKELGDVKVIYTGPTTTTAEAQIDVLNGLIAQGGGCDRHFRQRSGRRGTGAEKSDAARHQGGLVGLRRGAGRPPDPS